MSRLGTLFFRYVFEKGDEKRLRKMGQDLSDIDIRSDIPYMQDGEQGHLLDIYSPLNTDKGLPVMINIHGGGLFASYKEVNANFNYEWARLKYNTVSISYRRIPDVTHKEQIRDVMSAIRYLYKNAGELGLDMDRAYLTGDSAGALLAYYVLSINGSSKLQEAFQEEGLGFRFKAAGFVSICLDTQRKDLMKCISNMVLSKEEYGNAYARYILDPVIMLDEAEYPPVYLVTSDQDLIQKDTFKLVEGFKKHGVGYRLSNFPKGKERKLDHVFAVKFPKWPESREVFNGMVDYFMEVKDNG